MLNYIVKPGKDYNSRRILPNGSEDNITIVLGDSDCNRHGRLFGGIESWVEWGEEVIVVEPLNTLFIYNSPVSSIFYARELTLTLKVTRFSGRERASICLLTFGVGHQSQQCRGSMTCRELPINIARFIIMNAYMLTNRFNREFEIIC